MRSSAEPGTERRVLTRQRVLVAALAMIDDDGVDALSMRRLGRALGRDPMRLYRFAESKEELLDGVVELVLQELEVPVGQPAEWEQACGRPRAAYRHLALAHPNVVPLLVTRPLATPLALRPLGTLRPLEALLELLVCAGFSPRGALHAYRLLHGVPAGARAERAAGAGARPGRDRRPARGWGCTGCLCASSPGCARSRATSRPTTAARSSEEGLDVVLGGLRRTLEVNTTEVSPRSEPPGVHLGC